MPGIIALCVVGAIGIGFITLIWRDTSERKTKSRRKQETGHNPSGDDHTIMYAHGHNDSHSVGGASSSETASGSDSGP